MVIRPKAVVQDVVRELNSRTAAAAQLQTVLIGPANRSRSAADAIESNHVEALPLVQLDSTSLSSAARLAGSKTVPDDDVLAVVTRPKAAPLRRFVDCDDPTAWFMALDAVSDPANVGSLLRSASFFGARAVLLGPGCADPLSTKSVAASRGGALTTPHILVRNWADLLQSRQKPLHVSLAVASGDSLPGFVMDPTDSDPFVQRWRVTRSESLPGPRVLVLGSEATGITAQALDAWTRRLLPGSHVVGVSIRGVGGVSCLNVGAAGAVLAMLASRERPSFSHRNR